jgi:predicted peptidase
MTAFRARRPAIVAWVALLSVLLQSCRTALPPQPGTRQTEQLFRYGPQSGIRYLLYLPDEYETIGRRWPLILFLHGSGERGDDLSLIKREGLPRMLERWRRFPFVVVSPQRRRGERWSPEKLFALLDEIFRTHRVDHSRVFVTGLSSGGDAALELAIRAPHRFAAVAAVAPLGLPENLCALREMPVRVFHSASDQRVPLGRSKRLVRALEECGGRAILTIYRQEGHDAWTMAYQTRELYDWLLEVSAHRTPSSSRRAPATEHSPSISVFVGCRPPMSTGQRVEG